MSAFRNALKIFIAAIAAICVAQYWGLAHVFSAGTIAILTIQPTKTETFSTALGRLYAFGTALIIAYISFYLFGFHVSSYFLFLVLFITICQHFHWYSAMTMHSVLVSHFVSYGSMAPQFVVNEVLLFVIGVSAGILANLHLHKKVNDMHRLKQEADGQITVILGFLSKRIMSKEKVSDDGNAFVILKKQIRAAKNLAEENYKNQFKKDDIFDMEYIIMRDKQCHVLYEMYKTVRMLDSSPDTAEMISDFLQEMARDFGQDNHGLEMMEDFRQMDIKMRSRPLPVTRKEFEDRARLFALMRSIEELIQIKMEFDGRFAQLPEGNGTGGSHI